MPGHNHDFVLTPEAILEDGSSIDGSVVILDEEGLHAAAGIAEIAAARGAAVELLTRKGIAVGGLVASSQARYVLGRLREAGVRVRTSSYVKGIGADHTVTTIHLATGEERAQHADHVVLATSRSPVDDLFEPLDADVEYLYLIGDALAPRTLRETTYEGFRFGFAIGEEPMPERVTDELFLPMETQHLPPRRKDR